MEESESAEPDCHFFFFYSIMNIKVEEKKARSEHPGGCCCVEIALYCRLSSGWDKRGSDCSKIGL